MLRRSFAVVLFVSAFLVACGSSTEAGGACERNSDCEETLLCIDDVCQEDYCTLLPNTCDECTSQQKASDCAMAIAAVEDDQDHASCKTVVDLWMPICAEEGN